MVALGVARNPDATGCQKPYVTQRATVAQLRNSPPPQGECNSLGGTRGVAVAAYSMKEEQ